MGIVGSVEEGGVAGVVGTSVGLVDSTVESVAASVVDPNGVDRVGDIVGRTGDIVEYRGTVVFVESSVVAFTVEVVTLVESSALHCIPCRRAPMKNKEN